MTEQQYREQRIWAYIDGVVSREEKEAIEQKLEQHIEWKSTYQKLLAVHRMLQSSELEHPPLRFTKNVMEKIAFLEIAPATKTYFDKKIIRGFAVFFLTLITGGIIYAFMQIEGSSGNSPAMNQYIDLSKLDFTLLLNNHIVTLLTMANVLLGLVLLDQLLAHKRKKYNKESG